MHMKAVLLTGHGGLEKLEYSEAVPILTIAPNDVLIKVYACGANNTEIWTREGAYGDESDPTATSGWRQEPMRFPRIQGSDIVGRIVQVGCQVSPSRAGERVIVNLALYAGSGEDLLDAGFIGGDRDGGFAEYVVAPAKNVISIPEKVSLEEAAMAA